ncbi:MAG: ABC transporter ATP-binding protein [Cytophagales bacterium]|nr:ABC transporter ATP-binding protein [Cytophagales bacterium]
MLQLTHLKKAYGPHIILNIPQLSIEAGAWWIKGNNGSGKTHPDENHCGHQSI